MIDQTALVPLPVVVPLVGAGIAVAVGAHPRVQRAVSLLTLTIVLGVAVSLLVVVDDSGPLVVQAGGWPVPLGITLVVDRLSALMLVVSTIVTLGVLLCSIGQSLARDSPGGERDEEDTPLPVFHPTLLVLSAGVANTFVAGDLFNLYVGFEILLFASFVLLTLSGTAERIRAGTGYVLVSLLSSAVFLAAIACIYAATGTVNMAQLAGRLDALPDDVRLVLQLIAFAGLLTKVGVYAIVRTQTLLFPDSRIDDLLLWEALATMLVGILGAVAQDDVKRLLSFTLVSHIGYMIFGIGVGSQIGLPSALFYVAHHIIVQTALFLVAGMVERRGGSTSLASLGGLVASSPLLAVLFLLPALNLAGIPPLSGFLGKVGLLQAGADAGTPLTYLLVAASVVTSLLTLYAIARVWGRAFWREQTEQVRARNPLPWGMLVPTGALVAVGLAMTVVAGPLFAVTDRAAADLRERSPYVDAVLEQPRVAGQTGDDP